MQTSTLNGPSWKCDIQALTLERLSQHLLLEDGTLILISTLEGSFDFVQPAPSCGTIFFAQVAQTVEKLSQCSRATQIFDLPGLERLLIFNRFKSRIRLCLDLIHLFQHLSSSFLNKTTL
jgi:hypothetical protein